MIASAYDITDSTTATAVVGSDPTAAALVALDIARAAALRRPVTIIDLTGGAPPLAAITQSEDPHGVADCFTYGISFAAVTQPTTDANVFLIPSGSEPLDYGTILPSSRWEQFGRTAREHHALLVFVVPPEAPELGELLARVDRVVAAESPTRMALPAPRFPTISRMGPAPGRRPRILELSVIGAMALAAIGLAAAYLRTVQQRRAVTPQVATAADSTAVHGDTVTSTSTAQLESISGSSANASGAGRYMVQFVSTDNHDTAQAIASRLAAISIPPHVDTSGPPDHRLYRVLSGPYATRRVADSVGRASHQPYWVKGRGQ